MYSVKFCNSVFYTLKEECDNIHRIRATVALVLDAADSMTHVTDFVAPALQNLSHSATEKYQSGISQKLCFCGLQG